MLVGSAAWRTGAAEGAGGAEIGAGFQMRRCGSAIAWTRTGAGVRSPTLPGQLSMRRPAARALGVCGWAKAVDATEAAKAVWAAATSVRANSTAIEAKKAIRR